MDRYINRVFCGDSIKLLRQLPTASISAVITDPPFGCGFSEYDWGKDHTHGNPIKYAEWMRPYYEECLRVLIPAGPLIWSQSTKYKNYFKEWYGDHRTVGLIWSRGRTRTFSTCWIVQSKERIALPFPDRDNVIITSKFPKTHPCAKPVEMMSWLIEAFTNFGDLLLDPFVGIGSTVIAAKQLGRNYIACDLSPNYTREALRRLKEV